MAKRILLADSSPVVRRDVEVALRGTGIEIFTAERGDRALELMRELRPDLLLADINLPGKNGYELCSLVRNQPSFESIPVVLLTGVYEDFDSERAANAGATSVISKPFRAEFFADRMRSLIAAPAPSSAAAEAQGSKAVQASEVEEDWDFSFDADTDLLHPRSRAGLSEQESSDGLKESDGWGLADLNLDAIEEPHRPSGEEEEQEEADFSGSERPTDPLHPPITAEVAADQAEAQAIFEALESAPQAREPAASPLTGLEALPSVTDVAIPVPPSEHSEDSLFEELEAASAWDVATAKSVQSIHPSMPPYEAKAKPSEPESPAETVIHSPSDWMRSMEVPRSGALASAAQHTDLEDEFFEEEYLLEETGPDAATPPRAAGPLETDEAEELEFTELGLESVYSGAAEPESELQEGERAEPLGEPAALQAPLQTEAPTAPEPAAQASPLDVQQLLSSEEFINRVALRVVEQLSERLIENIAWEVVPDIAEREIRAAIAEITKEG